MPGFLLHVGAGIACPHGGQASITVAAPRVKAMGQPVAVLSDPTTVAGCAFQVPVGAGTKPQPCMTVRWLVGAARVRVNGTPVLLQTSSGLCQSAEGIPQGPPTVSMTQTRVRGM
ncbi:hypothetical protein IBL26_18535 [Roseomonas aerophila]|uniref:DUF4280 domain-containing protein n=1 Tax=Teichococcus aerophilus TaxID=1224513 RepID=A0ABR7RS28_9PROT|nr:hypothetical protein [Pseudoroseomonas aerophila]MBC9208852.1 hypothetical protein [Pseudoroseomonas aerophila]